MIIDVEIGAFQNVESAKLRILTAGTKVGIRNSKIENFSLSTSIINVQFSSVFQNS